MLAAALSDPGQVTLNWLRLAGIIALCMAGLAAFFYSQRESAAAVPLLDRRVQFALVGTAVLAILGQLAFAQVAWRATQRLLAFTAFILAVLAGANLLHELMIPSGAAARFPPKMLSIAIRTVACAGIAAMTGLVLMDMLLGHAYLTASKMTIAPFRRLNLALAAALVLRTLVAVGAVLWLQSHRPVEMLWGVFGLYMLTRWGVGLLVPGVFVYMADDCVRRRSTQSATGILYVTGVLVFTGEIVALYLVRETGLPF